MKEPKVILIILDGWGYSTVKKGNAILSAQKPNFDSLWQQYPHTLLKCSGEEVGLPWGAIGSSEVGHLTIGSGCLIYQDLPRVTQAISKGTFFKTPALLDAIDYAKTNHSTLHLVGLISPGGVHSHLSHLQALLDLTKKRRFSGQILIHMFTDGRDTPPKSALAYLAKIESSIQKLHLNTQIASVIGRYYAMDRDHHWDRTYLAYNCLTKGSEITASSAKEAIEKAYARGETDEFIKPTSVTVAPHQSWLSELLEKPADSSPATGVIKEKDSVIFFNFRPDRMRQIVELFALPRREMPAKINFKNVLLTSLTQYQEELPIKIAFPPERPPCTLAEILSSNNLTQLHIAETEKYAHVTYFFNGGFPQPHQGEKWCLVPSPKVPTYDKKPAMSAPEITQTIIKEHEKTPFDFILVNFANADMVGHSGDLEATIKAVETIDQQLGLIYQTFPNSCIMITADHGNAESKTDPQTGEPNKEHTINPVPFTLIHPKLKLPHLDSTPPQATGILADISPTILDIYQLPKPRDMTGLSLLETLYPGSTKLFQSK